VTRFVAVHLENVKTGRVASRVHGLRLGDGSRATLCGLDIFLANPAVQFSVIDSDPSVQLINCPSCKEKIQ
jgi:hypothetical protein